MSGDTRPMIVKPHGPTALSSLLMAIPALAPILVVPMFTEPLESRLAPLPHVSEVVYSNTTSLSVMFFIVVFGLGYIHRKLQVVALIFFLGFAAFGIALPHTG